LTLSDLKVKIQLILLREINQYRARQMSESSQLALTKPTPPKSADQSANWSILDKGWERNRGISLDHNTRNRTVECSRCGMKVTLPVFVQKHAPALCDVLVTLKPRNFPVLNVNLLFKATGLDPDGSWRISQPNQMLCTQLDQMRDQTEPDQPRVR